MAFNFLKVSPFKRKLMNWYRLFCCMIMIKSTEQQFAVGGTVYCAVQAGSNFWVCGWNPEVWPFKWKLLSSNFLWYCLLCCTKGSFFWVCGWNPKVWPFKWKLLSSTFLWCCLLCCTKGSFFWVCRWNPKLWPFKWKLLSSTLVSCATVYYAAQDGSIFLC